MLRTRGSRTRRQGAVLVEGLIVANLLIILLGAIAYAHSFAAVDIRTAQEARFRAWQRSMNGCQEQEFGLQTLMSDVAEGELPLPDSFLPTDRAEGSAESSLPAYLGGSLRTVRHTVRFPCRASPPRLDQQPGAWIFDLFQ